MAADSTTLEKEIRDVELARTATARSAATAVSIPALAILTWINVLPQTLIVPVLKDIVTDRFQVSAFSTHLFMVVNMVGAVLFAPLAGRLADRLGDRRRLMVAALVVDGLALLSLSLVENFELALVVRFVEGAANIAGLSMCLAIAADEAKRREKPRLMGLIGGSLIFGVAVGVPLGGLLGNNAPMLPLQVGAALTFATAVFALLLLPSQLGTGEAAVAPEDRRLLAREPRLIVPFAFAFVDRFTVGFFTSTFTIHLRTVYEAEPRTIGMLLALFLIPFSFLSWPMGRATERFGLVRLVVFGSLIYGLLVLPVGTLSPSELPLLMFAIGIASSVMYVPTLMLTAKLSPLGSRGAAMGSFNAAGSLGFLIGPLVAGQSHALFGAEGAFLVAGASEILLVLALAPSLKRLATSLKSVPLQDDAEAERSPLDRKPSPPKVPTETSP